MIANSSRARVLIAEDSSEVASRLAEALREVGNLDVVGVATDGHEALRMHRETAPRVVLLDLSMPGPSGVSLLERLRTQDAGCAIVVFTSHAEPALREACLRAGAAAFLSKTTDLAVVVAVVQAQLAA